MVAGRIEYHVGSGGKEVGWERVRTINGEVEIIESGGVGSTIDGKGPGVWGGRIRGRGGCGGRGEGEEEGEEGEEDEEEDREWEYDGGNWK